MLSPSLADTPHLSSSAWAPVGCAAFLCSVEACQGRKLQVHEWAASVDRTLSRGVCEHARVHVFWCWDLLLVQSCIDAVCHCRLGPVSADLPLAPPPGLSRLERRQPTGRALTWLPCPPPIPAALAAPPTYSNPIFLPPASVLLLAHNLIYSARPSVAKELKWRQKRVCRRVSDRAWKKRRGVPLDRFWGNKRTVGGETLTK